MINLELLSQLLISGVVLGSTYALIAVSFGIIYSTTRVFHLAHSVVYTFAAYGSFLALKFAGFPLWLAVPVGLLVAVLSGMAMELIAYRPMRQRAATALTTFLVSLGLTIAAPNFLQIVFGPENKPLPGFPIRTITAGRLTATTLDITSVITAWTLIAALLLFLRLTRYGRAIDAVRSNTLMAMAVGIPLERMFLVVFAVGSLLVGVSSLLFTMNGVAFPNMGLAPILVGFIGVFLGGIGSLPGAALGGLIVGLATSLSGLWLSGDFSSVVVFGLLFVLLVVRPQGLLGRAVR